MENQDNLIKTNVTLRDYYAVESLKALISSQSNPRMTPLSRFKFWLGGEGWAKGWKANYDYNFTDASKYAFELADEMLKQRNK